MLYTMHLYKFTKTLIPEIFLTTILSNYDVSSERKHNRWHVLHIYVQALFVLDISDLYSTQNKLSIQCQIWNNIGKNIISRRMQMPKHNEQHEEQYL